MKPNSFLETRRVDAEIAEKVFGFKPETVPHYSTEMEQARRIIERLRKADIEVILGCFKDSFSVELRRSRVTFVCLTGFVSLEWALATASLRPETLEILNG